MGPALGVEEAGEGGKGGLRGVPGLQVTTCHHPGETPAKSASSRGWLAAQPAPAHVPAAPRPAAEEDRMQPQPAATALLIDYSNQHWYAVLHIVHFSLRWSEIADLMASQPCSHSNMSCNGVAGAISAHSRSSNPDYLQQHSCSVHCLVQLPSAAMSLGQQQQQQQQQ